MTFDVDIVHRGSQENVDKLLAILSQLHAYVREPTQRRLSLNREALVGAGHELFVTDLGPLDCLGSIEGGLDYDSLLPHSIELDLNGRVVRVVGLETLVELKEQWSDDESKLRATILRRMLDVAKQTR